MLMASCNLLAAATRESSHDSRDIYRCRDNTKLLARPIHATTTHNAEIWIIDENNRGITRSVGGVDLRVSNGPKNCAISRKSTVETAQLRPRSRTNRFQTPRDFSSADNALQCTRRLRRTLFRRCGAKFRYVRRGTYSSRSLILIGTIFGRCLQSTNELARKRFERTVADCSRRVAYR